MKDVFEYIEGEINSLHANLKPYYEQYGTKNAFELYRMTNLPKPSREYILETVSRLGAYVKVLNKLQTAYLPGHIDFQDLEADEEKKRAAIYSVAGEVLKSSTSDGKVSWNTLDSQTTDSVLNTTIGCIMAGNLEDAILGLSYVLFQEKFMETNQGNKKLEELLPQA